MLIETTKALYNKLRSINDNIDVKSVCDVKVLMSEKYQEIIANADRKTDEKKVPYPIIVIYEGENLEYDVERYTNDEITRKVSSYLRDGTKVYYSDVYNPMLPYNILYKIEIICDKRIQLDTILLWVMRNIPDRYVLQVPYKGQDDNIHIYDANYKRGNIIKADESTSSTLYRRIFEMKITTLIESTPKQEVIQVGGAKVNGIIKTFIKESENDG